MTVTDSIVLMLLLYYGFSGWRKGFLRSLLGPIAFIGCAILSTLYFQRTQNMMLSLGIGLLGPLVISFLGSVILSLFEQASGKESGFSLVNRFLGSLFSLTWGVGLIALSIFFFSITPPQYFGLQKAKEDLLRSRSYAIFSTEIKDRFFPPKITATPEKVSAVLSSPAAVQETPEYKVLMADKRIQDLVSDEETMRQIREKDMAGLFNNPKIFSIMQDRELVMKFLELNKKLGGVAPGVEEKK